MSARRIDNTDCFDTSVPLAFSGGTRLDLPTHSVSVHRNGIEFRSQTPIPVWTEMTVDLETPPPAKKVSCTGIIVSCTGTDQTGYTLSMVFTGLSRHAEAQLKSLALSP